MFNGARDFLLSFTIVRYISAFFIPWFKVIFIVIESIFSIIINPSFIIFSILALGLGTLGIWISYFPTTGGSASPINPTLPLDQVMAGLENLSVFTFSIATLGNMATEYFFVNDERKFAEQSGEGLLQQHIAIIMWAAALLCTFWALSDDEGILYCLCITLSLWMAVNVKRERFNKIDEDAFNLLKPEPANQKDDDIQGGGL